MIRKLSFIVIIYLTVVIINSCCDDVTKYSVKFINFEIKIKNKIIDLNDNLEFNLDAIDSIVGIACNRQNLQLINSLYAFDCYEEPYYIPIATVDQFRVKLLSDFNNEFQINDYITDKMKVRFFNSRSSKIEIIPLQDFFQLIRDDDWAPSRSAELQNATYILETRPTIDSLQIFEFEFYLTDNSMITSTTDTIEWK